MRPSALGQEDKGRNLGVANMAAVKGEQQATATDAATL